MDNNTEDGNIDSIPMQSLREEQVRLTQQRILDTFESELIKNGYAEVSIRSIAKRAAISVPTVYRYYPNKQALLMALMASSSTESSVDYVSILSQDLEPIDTITRLLDELWDVNERQPTRTKAILLAIAAAGEGEGAELTEDICKQFAFLAREALRPLNYLPAGDIRKLEALTALLLGRPTWHRLRFGHNLTREVARDTVLFGIRSAIEAATSAHKQTSKNGKHTEGSSVDRSPAALRKRFELATQNL